MNQQRSRRFRSALEAKYVNTLYAVYVLLLLIYIIVSLQLIVHCKQLIKQHIIIINFLFYPLFKTFYVQLHLPFVLLHILTCIYVVAPKSS